MRKAIELVEELVCSWLETDARVDSMGGEAGPDGAVVSVYGMTNDAPRSLARRIVRHLFAHSEGSRLIAEERRRAIEREGYTAEHDDLHASGELALAGACYAASAVDADDVQVLRGAEDAWPWTDGDRRGDLPRLRLLVIAGQFIAAELDRLLRLSTGCDYVVTRGDKVRATMVRDEALGNPFSEDVGELPPRNDLFNHSPDGFEFGYQGSGPAQLALAILAHASRDDDFAVRHHQAFKRDVVAAMSRDETRHVVTYVDVVSWAVGAGLTWPSNTEGTANSDGVFSE